jgi:hypothetical protein
MIYYRKLLLEKKEKLFFAETDYTVFSYDLVASPAFNLSLNSSKNPKNIPVEINDYSSFFENFGQPIGVSSRTIGNIYK